MKQKEKKEKVKKVQDDLLQKKKKRKSREKGTLEQHEDSLYGVDLADFRKTGWDKSADKLF